MRLKRAAQIGILTLAGLLSACTTSTGGSPGGGTPLIRPKADETVLQDLPLEFTVQNALGECTITLDGEPHVDYTGQPYTLQGDKLTLDDLPNGEHAIGVQCANGSASTRVTISVPDGITYETGSAQAYADSLGLGVDATPFDSDRHFTSWEKAYLDLLEAIKRDGRFTEEDLNAWMQYAGKTAGPMLVRSVQETFQSWKDMVQYESWLRFYPGVNGAFTLTGFLEGWSLPARVADPAIGGAPRLNNYPINYAASHLDNMNWDPTFETYTSCFDIFTSYKDHGSGEQHDEGMNFPFYIEYMDMARRPHYKYGHPFLRAAKVMNITEHVWDERDQGGYMWREFNYTVRAYFPSYDRLIFDTPDHYLYATISHVVHPTDNMARVEDMPYQEGDWVPYRGVFGILHWQPVSAFNGDLFIYTEGEGMPYTVPFEEYDGVRHYTAYGIDPVCAAWYPKDLSNPFTGFNFGFTDVRWTQDPTIFAPLPNRKTGQWDPVPTR